MNLAIAVVFPNGSCRPHVHHAPVQMAQAPMTQPSEYQVDLGPWLAIDRGVKTVALRAGV